MLECGRLAVGRSIALSAGTLLAACGGSSHDASVVPDGTLDGMDPRAQAITVRFKSTVNLALIAFRDGQTGAWQSPPTTAPGSYQLMVHGAYTVVDVCTFSGGARTRALSRTLADPHEIDLACFDSVPLSHVTGSMGVSGVVTVGTRVGIAMSDGAFDVQIPDGIYDVIARSPSQSASQERIAIRRSVMVAGDTTVPAIDLVAEGTAMTLVEPTVTNLAAGETLDVTGVLQTPAAAIRVTYLGGVHVLPDAALGPRDTQSLEIEGTTSSETEFAQRSITRRYVAGASLMFALPPALAVQYTTSAGRPIATWSSLPPFAQLQFSIEQLELNSAGLVVTQVADLSPTYVAATGATSAAFDTDVPGYNLAWQTEVTVPWLRTVRLTRVDGGDALLLSHEETVKLEASRPSAEPTGSPESRQDVAISTLYALNTYPQ